MFDKHNQKLFIFAFMAIFVSYSPLFWGYGGIYMAHETQYITTRNLLTSDPSFWSLDGHCCSTYDPLLTKNSWSAVERH
jgi:hypothetical protein